MTGFEKIIVVVLGLLSPVVSLGYIIGSWALLGTPAELKDKITVIRDKRIILCRRMPHGQIDDCEKHANGMWQMQGLIIDDADKKGQEAFLILLWQNADKVEAEIAEMERRFER